jgi:hypothetical protein
MKKVVGLFLILSMILVSCGPKPGYKTRTGKQKQKHYNALQYNKADWDKARKKPKKQKPKKN